MTQPSDWNLIRETRGWVPKWLWRFFTYGNLATFFPFDVILTKKVRP